MTSDAEYGQKEIDIFLPKLKPKQRIIWESKATEILIAGDTRSGKSFFVKWAYINYCSEIPRLVTDILRVNYEDVCKNYMVGDNCFPELLDPWEREGLVSFTENEVKFCNESLITLGHCFDERAIRKHQGNPTHLRTIEESAQMIEDVIRALGGWITITKAERERIPIEWRDQFPKLWHLTNFKGPGMNYYRRGFLEPREPFVIEKVGQHLRQYIPMYLIDNDSEDIQATIARIREAYPDPAVQSALLECNWRAMIGDFYQEWSEERHVVTDFSPPHHWFHYRAIDWGTAEPCAIGYFAISDGEPFKTKETDDLGDTMYASRWFPRGAIIMYDEWYLSDDASPAKGNRMRNEDIAQGIIQRSELGFEKVITLADSKPFQDMGGEGIAETFMKNGVVLSMADTSRISGWTQLRSKLIGIEIDAESPRVPMFFVCSRCRAARTYMPQLRRHPRDNKGEDAQEHGEATHVCDMIRYGTNIHKIITDAHQPMETKIAKELERRKPTMAKITAAQGGGFFKRPGT